MLNENILTNFTLQAAVIIPIVTAVVQALKFWVKDKYAPFVAMVVGIGITFLFAHDALADLSGNIMVGILFGLASSGLYSGLQHTTKVLKMEKQQQQSKQQNNQSQSRSQQTCNQETEMIKTEHVYEQKTKNPHDK